MRARVGVCVFVLSLCGCGQETTCVAEWVFAITEKQVVTNTIGDVVQPPSGKPTVGAWRDSWLYVEEELRDCFSRISIDQIREWVDAESRDAQVNEAALSEAVSSVRLEVSKDPIPIVRVSVVAESRELALSLMQFEACTITGLVEAEAKRRIDKAVAGCRMKACLEKERGTDAALVDATLEASINMVLKQRRRIITLRSPRLVD